MSIVNEIGERVELSRSTLEQETVLAQLMQEWAGGDPVRTRWLAALVLRVNGWTYEQIGVALSCDRGVARRRVQGALSEIRGRFVPPEELPAAERGFSNPDRPG